MPFAQNSNFDFHDVKHIDNNRSTKYQQQRITNHALTGGVWKPSPYPQCIFPLDFI